MKIVYPKTLTHVENRIDAVRCVPPYDVFIVGAVEGGNHVALTRSIPASDWDNVYPVLCLLENMTQSELEHYIESDPNPVTIIKDDGTELIIPKEGEPANGIYPVEYFIPVYVDDSFGEYATAERLIITTTITYTECQCPVTFLYSPEALGNAK